MQRRLTFLVATDLQGAQRAWCRDDSREEYGWGGGDRGRNIVSDSDGDRGREDDSGRSQDIDENGSYVGCWSLCRREDADGYRDSDSDGFSGDNKD